jgi:hypothetical protein
MSFKKASCFLSLTVALVFLAACSGSKKPVAERPPAPQATPVEPASQTANGLPPAELKAVEAAVSRVFKDAAVIDTSHKPMFVDGDFNGDQSADIAVVLKPSADKLPQMNEEFPNWILRSPFGEVDQSPRLRIAANDELLAVIHGYGSEGWRDPQATQTYLLKDAVGLNMETRSATDLQRASAGKKMPFLRGDVIAEVIHGKPGFLYLSNSSYGWYDPQTFTGEPEPRRGHGGPMRRTNR